MASWVMPVIGGGIEVTREPGELRRRRVCHVGVDRDLHQVGSHDIRSSLDEDGDSREDDLEPIRAEIGEQPPHQATVVDLAYDLVVLRGLFCRLFRCAAGSLLIGHLDTF